MNVAVITACLFLSESPIHYLKTSCERFGVPLRPYGLGESYTGWPDIKINRMLTEFKVLRSEFTHVLYTDGRDSFFLGPLSEAIEKYEHVYGAPDCVMATEPACYPHTELADRFPDPGHRYRWPGSGQFMGRLDYLIDAWTMLRRFGDSEDDQNEQGWMLKAFLDGRFGEGFKLDTQCAIFQSAGNGSSSVGIGIGRELQMRAGRITNTVTGSEPVIIHMNGGYTCPINGKWDAIEPVWRALGYPPTERKEIA